MIVYNLGESSPALGRYLENSNIKPQYHIGYHIQYLLDITNCEI
jgi:hypothetical protein